MTEFRETFKVGFKGWDWSIGSLEEAPMWWTPSAGNEARLFGKLVLKSERLMVESELIVTS